MVLASNLASCQPTLLSAAQCHSVLSPVWSFPECQEVGLVSFLVDFLLSKLVAGLEIQDNNHHPTHSDFLPKPCNFRHCKVLRVDSTV